MGLEQICPICGFECDQAGDEVQRQAGLRGFRGDGDTALLGWNIGFLWTLRLQEPPHSVVLVWAGLSVTSS